jgi:hypothetical protein
MVYYKIVVKPDKDEIYLHNRLIGYLIRQDKGLIFKSNIEDISIYLDDEICKFILIGRPKTYEIYIEYSLDTSWNNFYKMIIYTILYLNDIRNNKFNLNSYEKQILDKIMNH